MTLIDIGSPEWFDWLAHASAFIFEAKSGRFSARREVRGGKNYWYAYRRREGKLLNAYLGKTEELDVKRLEEAGVALAGSQPVRLSGAGLDLVDPNPAFLSRVRSPVLPSAHVVRPRLTSRMNTPLTLVYAPGGFGKTLLIAAWRRLCPFPVTWITFRSEDNQPLRFWALLIAALQNTPGLNSAGFTTIQVATAADLPAAFSQLTAELSQRADLLGLVFDDYHHIRSTRINAQVQTWLDHLPPALRLVISGRTKPAFALGRLRAQGQLTELAMDDLRFNLEESADFMHLHPLGEPLTHREVETLVRRTDGWIAGLKLAALGLSQAPDRGEFIAAFGGTHAYLREYFAESVLQGQPPAVRTFLLKTSILQRLSGSLCDALTGFDNGRDMLARLWQDNLFITRSEGQQRYHYNELFAEMLQAQLQKQLPAEVPELHRRAAAWYVQENALDEAIYHLLAIQAWDEAAALIEDMAVHELADHGEDSRLLRWLRQLPEAVVQQHKSLVLLYARLGVVALSQSEVDHYLTRIERNLQSKLPGDQTPDEQDILSEIQRIRPLAASGSPLSAPLPTTGEKDAFWQLLGKLTTVVSPSSLRLTTESVEQLAQEVYESARAQDNLFVLLMAAASCAERKTLRGDLREAERIITQALQHAVERRGRLPETASITLGHLALLHYERNQLAEVHQLLARIRQVDPNPTSSNLPVLSAIMQARLEFAESQPEAALATIQSALELQRRRPSGILIDQDLQVYAAWFRLRNGDTAGAEQALNAVEIQGLHPLSEVVRADILLARGQAVSAEAILTHLLNLTSCKLVLEPVILIQILLAVALLKQNKGHQALRLIAGLLRSAAAENFIRPFLDHGQDLASLLTLVLHTENPAAETKAFIKTILHLTGHDYEAQPALPQEYQALSVAASITQREQEVLRLLAAGLTNSEMARQLSVSESTVKTHLANIYAKLKVNGRVQALAQVQALKLV